MRSPNRDSGRRRRAYIPVPTKLHPITGPNTAQMRSVKWSLLRTSAASASPASSAAAAMTMC